MRVRAVTGDRGQESKVRAIPRDIVQDKGLGHGQGHDQESKVRAIPRDKGARSGSGTGAGLWRVQDHG